MSTLPDLLKSLVTAIVRYHARKTSASETPEETTVHDLLACEDIDSRLSVLITESTASDATRRPLLNYLLHIIQSIKPIVDGKISLEGEHADALRTQLIQFYKDVVLLLNTRQSSQIPINYGATTSQHYGLITGIWPVASWSVSGAVINELLLPIVDISYTDNPTLVDLKVTAFVQAAKIAALEQIIRTKDIELQQSRKKNAQLERELAEKQPSELPAILETDPLMDGASPVRKGGDDSPTIPAPTSRLTIGRTPLLMHRGTFFGPWGLAAALAFPDHRFPRVPKTETEGAEPPQAQHKPDL
ncbi:hypothetical protein [Legionella nagasakiensis]|uniref:hypothetical protein n=1 Tax=Legionella nagasakiensis TaxID=535290 RepID=UPI001056C78F|nr:hypothetical protein [Legionella nagasakiensis]